MKKNFKNIFYAQFVWLPGIWKHILRRCFQLLSNKREERKKVSCLGDNRVDILELKMGIQF